MVPCKSTAEEVSFEWSHHRISSTGSKDRTTLHVSIIDSGSEKVDLCIPELLYWYSPSVLFLPLVCMCCGSIFLGGFENFQTSLIFALSQIMPINPRQRVIKIKLV